MDVSRPRDVSLARIARIPALTLELDIGADVQDHEHPIVESAEKLVARRHRIEARLERRLDRVQLDLADLGLAAPRGEAAEQHRNARMSGELGHLRRGHRADTVAAVVEHQALVAGDAVAAQSKPDLRRERLQHVAVAHRRRRSEHERARAGNVPACMRVRPAHVAEHEILRAELAFEPVDVDDGRKLRHDRGTPSGAR